MGSRSTRRVRALRSARVVAAALAVVATLLTVGPPPVAATEVPGERFSDITGPTKLGEDMDVSGRFAVVGAPTNGGSNGQAYVLQHLNGSWTRIQTLNSSGSAINYGNAVAIEGNYLAVGGESVLDIYERPNASSPFAPVVSLSGRDLAYSIDIAGDALIVGERDGANNLVEVYERGIGPNQWDLATTLTVPAGNDIDLSVAITPGLNTAGPGPVNDDIFVYVGAPRAGVNEEGEVYSYKKSNGAWGTTADVTLTQSPGGAGGGTGFFGSALEVDDDTLIIGQALEDTGGADSGAVWVYQGEHGAFPAPTQLKAPSPLASNAFGLDLDFDPISGLLAVGEPAHFNSSVGARTGAVHVFDVDGGGGIPAIEFVTAYDAAANDQFGRSVAITSETQGTVEQVDYLLVGAIGVDVTDGASTQPDAGAVYPFWIDEPDAPANKLLSDNGPLTRDFGRSVSNEGNTLAIGVPGSSGDDGEVEIRTKVNGASVQGPVDQVVDGQFSGVGFGHHVELSGDLMAVAYRNRDEVELFRRPSPGGLYAYEGTVVLSGTISGIALDGDLLAVISDTTNDVLIGTWDGASLISSATFPLGDPGRSVSVDRNLGVVAVGVYATSGSAPGRVETFFDSGVSGFVTGTTITNPDAITTGDVFFGDAVALDGDTLAVGVHDSDDAPFSGAVWIYESQGSGTFGSPVKIKSASPGSSDAFGARLDIDTDIIAVGYPGAGNGPGLNGRTGAAALIKRDPDTGIWSLDSEFQAPDRSLFDQGFGQDVTVSGGELAVGAPNDDNENGERGGAVYTFVTPVPEAAATPTLTVAVAPSVATAPAGATGVSVVDLPPTAIEGYGGSGSNNIVGTSLNTVGGAATPADPSEILDETTIADLGLDGSLLDSILLSDVIVDGGWETVLAGSAFDGLPLQNVTLGEVIDAGLLNGQTLSTLDLSATPIGAIPIGAIAVGATPIGAIDLPGGLDWCVLLGDISPGYNCSTVPAADPLNDTLIDLAIQGTPIGAIPIGAIPVGEIPIGAIPIGAIPIGAIDIEGTPIGAIPVESIPIGAIPIGAIDIGSIPIGAIPIGAIDVGSTPIGAIPIGAIPIGAIQLGALTDNGGVAASPIGAIPIGAIDVAGSPIGAIPIGAIPIGAIDIESIPIGAIPIGAIEIDSTPIGAIPIGAIDIAGTPIGAIPIGAIDVTAAPIGAIPIGAIGIESIPIGAIPIGAIAIGSVPIGAIDLAASPIGAIPIGAIPIGAIDGFVDCTLIDCDPAAGFTLADAQEAGALQSTATLAQFEGLDTGVTFADLVGVDGLDEAAIRAQLDAQASTGVGTLADFLTYDDLTLVELPDGPELAGTVLSQLGAGLSTVSLGDLLAATNGDETALRADLTAEGVNALADLVDFDGLTLGDLPAGDPNFTAQTIDDLLPAMENIRLGDLLDLHPTLTGADVDWGTATAGDISDWQDVTLEELASYNGTTLADLITALTGAGAEGDLTFGDLLLALVGTEAHDWTDVELGALELETTSSPITITTDFQISGGNSSLYSMELRTTLPLDAAYVPGSTVIQGTDDPTPPGGAGEPTIEGNQLVWNFNGVRLGEDYTVDIQIAPSLALGTSTVTSEGTIAGFGVQSTGLGSVGIAQAFEPNDVPGDSGILDVVSDTIYASHIATADDIDLYRVDLTAGSRLAVSLSDLPADFDLVVYGPPAAPITVQPPLRQLNPTEVPDVGLEAAANDSGGAVLQDVPLLADLPVVDVSTNRDTETESIDIASVRSTGTYFIQVSGYSGATSTDPYALFVKAVDPPAPLVCAAQDYQDAAEAGTLPTAGELAGVNTLVLINRERLVAKYGTDAQTALDAIDDLVTYTNVTDPGLGVTAAIVPVDGDANVRAAYNALDAAACEPDRANDVVREINRVIDTMRDADPATEITQVMIVGDDDIIPMARLADDTTIANESGYAQTFLGTEANSYFGALINSFYLSDEPYGDLDPIQSGERVLYVADIALGRMVETPAEIAGQVLAFIGSSGQLSPSTALVTGYDFLDDGSQSVADSLTALPDINTVDAIISETWTADDVIDALFPPTGGSPGVASVNAHYDHYRALPADQNAAGIEDDLFTTGDVDDPTRAGTLTGHILFTMGCHGGLHVPDELFGSADPRALDWAQAFARQGATYVANTGYGYGETEGVELSERLMALYAANLDGSVSAAEALLFAKQTYLGTQQAEYGAFDEKVLQEATFYGIPFYRLAVAQVPPPEPIPAQPTTVPVSGTGLEVTTISADPSFSPNSVVDQGLSYTASLPAGDPGVPDQQSTPYAPIEPTVSYDVSFVDPVTGEPVQVAQGALITGLTTTDVGGIDPDIALPIVDDSSVETEPEVGDINTDPAVFVSSYLTPEGPRQAVTSLLGTFTSDQADGTGTQRLFEEITLDVYYRDPATDTDQIRPVFASVTSVIDGGVLVIEADVSDDDGTGGPGDVVRVLALVVEDAATGTVWTPVELVDQGNGVWSGSLVITGTEIEYLVQAVDGAGNTALTTNKARLFAEDPTPPPVDPTITVTASSAPANDPWYDGAVTLTATADGEPIDYSVDGGPLVTAGATATVVLDPAVLGDGAVEVVFTSGNTTRTETVLFDTTAPTVAITSPAAGAQLPDDEAVLVTFSCADAASGLATCDATLDGSPVASGDEVVLAVGSYTIDLSGTDSVGNSASTSLTFDVVPSGPSGDPLTLTEFEVLGAALPGEEVEVVAGFVGGNGPHTVTIDWGDGTTCTAPGDPDCTSVEPEGGEPGEITATHSYGSAQTFTVTLTITSATGETATATRRVRPCTIVGTSGDDRIVGTNGDDIICGLGGDDILIGRNGFDILIGGAGDDDLQGGNQADVLFGGRGADILRGGSGPDLLAGGAGPDTLLGQGSGDVLFGGRGDDDLRGGSGDDLLIGNRGDDLLNGESGRDVLWGDRGLDTLLGGSGADDLIGGRDADVLRGGNGPDILWGRSGDDDLDGGRGPDEVRGGSGIDVCRPSPGADVFFGCEL